MKRANKFTIPPNWKVLFNDLGIKLQDALAHAQLPTGLFSKSKVQLTPREYFQFWHGLEAAANNSDIPLELSKAMSLESFDVPILAAVCSPNLNAAVLRLQEYKPLIGPMSLDLEITPHHTQIEISCYGYDGELPKTLNLAELVFLTQLARMATRQHITPIDVTLPKLPNSLLKYEQYFGCSIVEGKKPRIRFRSKDANSPFLTDNHAMFSMFENELQNKLDAVLQEASTADKVSGILMNLLPRGESSIESVASQMAMSKRTLQRKLSAEDINYQALLQQVRTQLADHYLTKTTLPLTEISFLLGFQESNSFIRAYSSWTGTPPGHVRE